MNTWGQKIIIILMLVVISSPVFAESLFSTGISQNHYPVQPRSLYNSGRAKTIGDIVTVLLEENIVANDSLKFKIVRASKVNDNFTPLINRALPEKWRLPTEDINGFGGGQDIQNTISNDRTVTYKDKITAQVTQVLPNGNLLVQGKKATVNNGERVDLVLSGVVDPRFITRDGTIDSAKVANLQLAFQGQGTVSRSSNEGLVNKFVRFLF